jgi:hypothetical protein
VYGDRADALDLELDPRVNLPHLRGDFGASNVLRAVAINELGVRREE